MTTGKFISLEGIEGAGKTTVATQLVDGLRKLDIQAVVFREPGSTLAGEQLRQLLKNKSVELSPLSEVFLFEAARHELVVQRIRPALATGTWVLVDRFHDSTTAYQGYGRGLDLEFLRMIHEWACGDTIPDLTLLLDVDPAIGLARRRLATQSDASVEEGDRYEDEGAAFLGRVREGFLALASKEPNRVVVVDAEGELGQIVERCFQLIVERLVKRKRRRPSLTAGKGGV